LAKLLLDDDKPVRGEALFISIKGKTGLMSGLWKNLVEPLVTLEEVVPFMLASKSKYN